MTDYKKLMRNPKNPLVFFDMEQKGKKLGRMVMELYADVTPKCAENFRCLCTGEKGNGRKGKPLHYKGSKFHRCIQGFMIQGGDFTNGNGTGGESIYGLKFRDENFKIKHNEIGQLSMANAGPNTNGSQFFITTSTPAYLNGKHTVFGKVIQGYGVATAIEKTRTNSNDAPLSPVVIADCGMVENVQKAQPSAKEKVKRGREQEAPVKKIRKDEGGARKEVPAKKKDVEVEMLCVEPPEFLQQQLQEKRRALQKRKILRVKKNA
eukprot:TRINITY_DN8509_c4_g1_i1.p1 TRINITY_DN8509_c4_g1~~TRINITY_DN8509_c4_g1_i1.p1  ORF type:complete len:281 (+),score=73.89 TRINITY_DN8509_c4_g1_i1:54-845(+)